MHITGGRRVVVLANGQGGPGGGNVQGVECPDPQARWFSYR